MLWFIQSACVQQFIDDLFSDNQSMNNSDYIQLYNRLKLWLSAINISSMDEKVLQSNFYQNFMKAYNQHIHHTLKYGDSFKGVIYKDLFQRLMPHFCIVDY